MDAFNFKWLTLIWLFFGITKGVFQHKNTCPFILSETTYSQGDTFGTKNALAFSCESPTWTHNPTFWLGPDGFIGEAFRIDYCAKKIVKGFKIANSFNSGSRDRATLKFQVEVSVDNENWNLALDDELEVIDPNIVACTDRTKTFDLPKHVFMRVARFIVVSFFERGPSLQYFEPLFEEDWPFVLEETSYSLSKQASHVKTFTCEKEIQENPSFWGGPNGFTGQAFVLDYLIEQMVFGFRIANSFNRIFQDRATRRFSIESSTNNNDWTLVLKNELEIIVDPSATPCENRIETFFLERPVPMRQVRFIIRQYHMQGPVIQYFQPLSKDFCPIVLEEDSWSLDASAINVITFSCEMKSINDLVSYWAGRNKMTGKGFSLDYCEQKLVYGFKMVNSFNRIHEDRGTANFSIEVSVNNKDWAKVVEDNLKELKSDVDCSKRIQIFWLDAPVYMQQLKFNVISYYGLGPSLQFLEPIEDETCPVVLQEDILKKDFKSSNAQTLTCELLDNSQQVSYWTPRQNFTGLAFTWDYCQQSLVVGFELVNSFNRATQSRGTKEFSIETSVENSIWTSVLRDELQDLDPNVFNCGSRLQYFSAQPVQMRQLRFNALSYYRSGPSLQYLRPVFKDECPIIIKDMSWSSLVTAKNVLTYKCEKNRFNFTEHTTGWKSPRRFKGTGFIFDFCQEKTITGFKLANTVWTPQSHRGTNEFSIEVSKDNKEWIEILASNLNFVDGNDQECADIVTFLLEKPVKMRQLKFVVKSYYKQGSGLEYLEPIYQTCESPSEYFFFHKGRFYNWNLPPMSLPEAEAECSSTNGATLAVPEDISDFSELMLAHPTYHPYTTAEIASATSYLNVMRPSDAVDGNLETYFTTWNFKDNYFPWLQLQLTSLSNVIGVEIYLLQDFQSKFKDVHVFVGLDPLSTKNTVSTNALCGKYVNAPKDPIEKTFIPCNTSLPGTYVVIQKTVHTTLALHVVEVMVRVQNTDKDLKSVELPLEKQTDGISYTDEGCSNKLQWTNGFPYTHNTEAQNSIRVGEVDSRMRLMEAGNIIGYSNETEYFKFVCMSKCLASECAATPNLLNGMQQDIVTDNIKIYYSGRKIGTEFNSLTPFYRQRQYLSVNSVLVLKRSLEVYELKYGAQVRKLKDVYTLYVARSKI